MSKLVLEFRDKRSNEVKAIKDLKHITEKEFKELRRQYRAYGKTVYIN